MLFMHCSKDLQVLKSVAEDDKSGLDLVIFTISCHHKRKIVKGSISYLPSYSHEQPGHLCKTVIIK